MFVSQGYRVIEGERPRGQHKDASAPPAQRAHGLMRFLTDPAVSAIMPPWGGELAIELLRLIDFEALRSVSPRWLLGYSDLSTLVTAHDHLRLGNCTRALSGVCRWAVVTRP
jgi:muramoyltetrapeptide carboxypeptidase LdcA involved in peptidoglycan recycling